MPNKLSRRYSFTTYDVSDNTITASAEDFFNVNEVYPTILFANSITFSRLSEVMGDIDEVSDDDSDNEKNEENWKKIGGKSPKFKDTQYEMGGYVSMYFGLAYSIEEEIGIDEFELRYVEWMEREIEDIQKHE